MQNQQPVVPADLKLQILSRNGKKSSRQDLPLIPDKLYFTIGEVSELCLVKPYVLRYWEKEFFQLNPSTRRGKRRYYQRTDILLIRQIKSLLYDQGFTIDGARNKLNKKEDQSSVAASLSKNKLINNIMLQLTKILSELEQH